MVLGRDGFSCKTLTHKKVQYYTEVISRMCNFFARSCGTILFVT